MVICWSLEWEVFYAKFSLKFQLNCARIFFFFQNWRFEGEDIPNCNSSILLFFQLYRDDKLRKRNENTFIFSLNDAGLFTLYNSKKNLTWNVTNLVV